MHSSSINKHPRFPFIDIGRTVDYAKQAGEYHHPDFIGSEDDWSFQIEKLSGLGTYRSESEAISASEKALFANYSHLADKYLEEAIESKNLELALSLAERRGFWQGRDQRQREIAVIVNDALSILKPLA
jgi:hypothetical protein